MVLKKAKSQRLSQGKPERYIQPSILMSLYVATSYGYEIIKRIQDYGFLEKKVPPGMIYRHLRQMEDAGLVTSEWKIEGSGPAKRIYAITAEGKEILAMWIYYMEGQAENLKNFINRYHNLPKTPNGK
ncbi:MAG: helix-turn-helix transcriptional regulator [Deltaproteobacteria bacterium]|nr:helix-turn-helix transcriptional regulator [Deltaproteobacteria bacterium]